MTSFVPSCSASLILRAASLAGLFVLFSIPFPFAGEAEIMYGKRTVSPHSPNFKGAVQRQDEES